MAVVALDREAARAAIRAAAGRFTTLLRETHDIGRQAAGTDWTVAETALQQCRFSSFVTLPFSLTGAFSSCLTIIPWLFVSRNASFPMTCRSAVTN